MWAIKPQHQVDRHIMPAETRSNKTDMKEQLKALMILMAEMKADNENQDRNENSAGATNDRKTNWLEKN